jgi:AraC-like DNA-binding protein/mannose-6-phosphate isomerase-like protein (cupin superfamily)
MKTSLEDLVVVPTYANGIAHAGRLRCEEGWWLGPGWDAQLRDYDLWYVWAGRGWMTTTDGIIELRPGRGLWMRAGRRYEAQHDRSAPLGVTFIHFRLNRPHARRGTLSPSAFVPPVEVFETAYPDFFGGATDHAVRLIVARRRREAALLLKLLLLEITAQPLPAPGGPEQYHQEAVNRILALITESDRPPAVHELARRAGYSTDHFSRVFRRVTGRSPKEFMIQARLERAVLLLRESSQTVTQISDALGYEEVGFFSRQFKQKYGLSPDQFRRSKAFSG